MVITAFLSFDRIRCFIGNAYDSIKKKKISTNLPIRISTRRYYSRKRLRNKSCLNWVCRPFRIRNRGIILLAAVLWLSFM